MRFLTLASLTLLQALAILASTQATIPSCALSCFARAIGKSVCKNQPFTDYYCQCTEGSNTIQKDTVQCLCDTNPCSAADLVQVQKASNEICSSALAASSQTYTAATLPANACATAGSGSSTKSTSAASNSASSTGSAGNNNAGAASSSSTGTGAAATRMPIVGYEGVLGLVGLAAAVL